MIDTTPIVSDFSFYPKAEQPANSTEVLWYLSRAVKVIQDAVNSVVLLFLNTLSYLSEYIEEAKDAALNACYELFVKIKNPAGSAGAYRPPPTAHKKAFLHNGTLAIAEPVAVACPPLESLQKGSVALEYFTHRAIAKDGNCLFAAVSYSLYGTEDRHAELRKMCCEKMKIEEFGAQYLLEAPHSQEGLKDYYEGWCVRKAEESSFQARRQRRDLVIKMGQDVIQNELQRRLLRKPSATDVYRTFMSQDKSHGGEVELATLAAELKRAILVFRGGSNSIDPQSEASLFGKDYRDAPPIVLYNMPGHYDAYAPKFEMLAV